jgi:hypothetical protein
MKNIKAVPDELEKHVDFWLRWIRRCHFNSEIPHRSGVVTRLHKCSSITGALPRRKLCNKWKHYKHSHLAIPVYRPRIIGCTGPSIICVHPSFRCVYIVANRPIARQRSQNRQLSNNRCQITAPQRSMFPQQKEDVTTGSDVFYAVRIDIRISNG